MRDRRQYKEGQKGGEKKKKDKSSSKKDSKTAAPAQPRADNIDLALDGVVAQVIGTLEKRMSREEIWSGSKEALITDKEALAKVSML